jgi:cell wall-associated NlpC family hydrolase
VIPFTVTAQPQGQGGAMSFAALLPIWQAAGNAYGIPWPVLAAINKVETNFGSNLGPSSAGAVGWMQFMPSTWARWGIDANGDGVADPNNPSDAIFSAARYLAGCGGQFDIARAVYCYNHASWYVNEVLGLASLYSQSGGAGGVGGVGVVFSKKQLQAQLASARTRVSASHALLGSARAQARKLARAEQKFMRVANSARLLTHQLDARKRAVLLGLRRQEAIARVNQLQKRLDAATSQLGQFRNEQNGPAFATNAPALLSNNLFMDGGGSTPYGGVVSLAMQYLGIPYKWGGASPTTGFDCSGLVQYVYAQVGISLPHYTVSQWNYPGAVPVPKNQLQPGDLVFFNGLDHVGIYIGYGDFIDAPHTGADVEIDSLSESWFASRYDGARRIVGAAVGGVPQAASAPGSTAFSSDIVYFTH